MKPFHKFIVSAFIVSLFLLFCAHLSSGLFNSKATKKELPVNTKTSLPSVDSSIAPATKKLILPYQKNNTGNIALASHKKNSTALSYAMVHISSRFNYKQHTDFSALVKKFAANGVSMHLNTSIVTADSINTQTTFTTGSNAEANTVKIQPVLQENTAIARSVYQHKKLAGTAYEAPTGTETVATIPATEAPVFSSIKPDKGSDFYSYSFLYDQTELLKEYAARSGSNTDYAIMINAGIKSAKKRFFVLDLSTNTIIKLGTVALGDKNLQYNKTYSNPAESISGMPGMYKTDKRAKNSNNLSYNFSAFTENSSNSRKSFLLQSSEDIPYDETGLPLPATEECISVSPRFFKEISPFIDDSVKPVLLLVFNPAASGQQSFTAVQKNK